MAENGVDLFVHVPRTGGTALRNTVIEHYGPDSVYIYGMTDGILIPANSQVYVQGNSRHARIRSVVRKIPLATEVVMALRRRQAVAPDRALERASAVIGHFTANAFVDSLGDRRSRLLTLVRDPLSRMVSHYQSVHRPVDSKPVPPGAWDSVGDSTLSFPDFALSEPLQDFQTHYTGADPARFDVLGTTDNYDGFLRRAGLEPPHDVDPASRNSKSYRPRDPIVDDPGFRRDFEAFHTRDYAFYRAAQSAGNLAV